MNKSYLTRFLLTVMAILIVCTGCEAMLGDLAGEDGADGLMVRGCKQVRIGIGKTFKSSTNALVIIELKCTSAG